MVSCTWDLSGDLPGATTLAARLSFVEIALAPVRGGLAVVLVDPRPRLEHFGVPARARILDALVALLAPEKVGAHDAPRVLA